MTDEHSGYTSLVVDMGFNPMSDIEGQVQDPVRSWIDKTITQISLKLWSLGASDPNGALFLIDYVMICDGTVRIPQSIRSAIIETARAINDGAGRGVTSESIGDYSVSFSESEASSVIPPAARSLLSPYRRPVW